MVIVASRLDVRSAGFPQERYPIPPRLDIVVERVSLVREHLGS